MDDDARRELEHTPWTSRDAAFPLAWQAYAWLAGFIEGDESRGYPSPENLDELLEALCEAEEGRLPGVDIRTGRTAELPDGRVVDARTGQTIAPAPHAEEEGWCAGSGRRLAGYGYNSDAHCPVCGLLVRLASEARVPHHYPRRLQPPVAAVPRRPSPSHLAQIQAAFRAGWNACVGAPGVSPPPTLPDALDEYVRRLDASAYEDGPDNREEQDQ